MAKVPLYFNNTARSARAEQFRHWAQRHAELFDLIEPTSSQEMHAELQKLAAKNAPLAAVAGGDGTLSIAAAALCNSNTALAVFPAGTMNVFAGEIGLHRNYHHALQVLQQGKMKQIDLFALNNTPFLQMAGIGLDARAVELTTWSMKKKWQAAAYLYAGIRALREPLATLQITDSNGHTITGNSILLGNGKKYGGTFSLFAQACNTDGKLDAVIFTGTAFSILKECLLAIIHGGFHPNRHGAFRYIQLNGGTVTSAPHNSAYETDGDFTGATPVTISYQGTIRVLVP